MKLYLTVATILFMIHDSFSQFDVQTVGNSQGLNTSGLWIIQKVNNNVEGSVFLFENWNTMGLLSTTDGKKLKIRDINYDTQADKIVAKFSNDSIFIFDDSNIKNVVINNRQFERMDVSGSPHYYEVLAKSSEIQILKINSKKLKLGQTNLLTQEKDADVYRDNPSYFSLKNNKLSEIKLKLKPFSELFGEHSKQIKKYISESNISLSEEKNLQSIVNYYMTL